MTVSEKGRLHEAATRLEVLDTDCVVGADADRPPIGEERSASGAVEVPADSPDSQHRPTAH